MPLRETYCVFHRRGLQNLEVLSKILLNSDTGDGLIYPHLSYGLGLWDACAGNQFLKAFRLLRKTTRITANLIPENLLDHNVKRHNFWVVSKFFRLFHSMCLNVPYKGSWRTQVWDTRQRQLPNWETQNDSLWGFAFTGQCAFHQHIAKFQKHSLTCKNKKRRSNLS